MSKAEKSYHYSCSEESSEDSDGGMTSDVKHLRYPNRYMRWPVGSPRLKNHVRGTPWNKNKGLRVESKDQQDMSRYVSGCMQTLLRKAQANIAAEFKEGGSGSTLLGHFATEEDEDCILISV